MPSIPASIGKYRILKEIGRGATSVVYLAEDAFNQRQVAIKQIHAHLLKDRKTAEPYLRSLRHEAQIAGRLRHPHIVGLLDTDLDANPPYLVLEYIAGQSLSACSTPDRLLPVPQVLDIAYKCCSALDHAHRRGLVHRDIKPANVMLQPDGGIKVADFGTAFSMKGDLTQVQGLVGSPLYIAPELVRGQPPSAHSDMFSLGVMLYELLTGRQPFEADTEFAVLYRIGNDDPPPPSALRREITPAIDKVIAKALAKQPKDRWRDWAEFAEGLVGVTRSFTESTRTRHRESERFVQMRALPFFGGFTDSALWETLRLGRVLEFRAGTELMRESEPGESFLVLLEGRVGVSSKGVHLITMESGTTLGEMSHLQPKNAVRSATAVAETDGVAVEILNESLRRASESTQILFDKAFIEVMVNRLIAANRKLGMWAGLDVLLGDNA